uniref:Peroxisomal membrane protein PEX14-like KPWE domain-containing protein n=1 Tax=Lates calcarifer TaxID=8187 RepID=A0A4W6EFS1_LATCA
MEQGTPSDSDSDISKNQAAESSAETEVKQLSFAEVMHLIQEGKEVPGAKKLDIKPSNQSPTPSQMERIRKPWELASSSKEHCTNPVISWVSPPALNSHTRSEALERRDPCLLKSLKCCIRSSLQCYSATVWTQ